MDPFCEAMEAEVIPQIITDGPEITSFLFSFERNYLSSSHKCTNNINQWYWFKLNKKS